MKTYLEYKGFRTNQIVLDANNTLARIIYFEVDESMNEKYNKDISLVRLGLIDHNGFEFANCTNLVDQIKSYKLINKPVTTTNEQPNEDLFDFFQLKAGGKKRCTDENGPCFCTKNQIIKCENN